MIWYDEIHENWVNGIDEKATPWAVWATARGQQKEEK